MSGDAIGSGGIGSGGIGSGGIGSGGIGCGSGGCKSGGVVIFCLIVVWRCDGGDGDGGVVDRRRRLR